MQHRNSNTLPKELTHESIKEIAEAHNYYLNIIHSTYGDIHQYNPTQVDDFYVEFLDSMGVLNNANKKNLKTFSLNLEKKANKNFCWPFLTAVN
ncbi:MAG TPA: hypothetical protein VFM82_09710 [Flavobacteriaceae bacterium]|nr:hypothetical protein [Flavobacteriaceae bacterium]